MGRIILTGDTHGDISRILKIDDSEMTKEDIVIILGDFGVIWGGRNSEIEDYCLELLGEKRFTVAFLDGNHENFSLIKEKENIVFWNDGYVGMLPHGIIHLLRGEVYHINGKRVGVCGGANSIDLWHRTEGISWWREEEITDDNIADFEANLSCNSHLFDNKLDLMLSHDAPASMIPLIKLYSGINDNNKVSNSQKQLEKILQMADIKKWYFGHWHINQKIDDKFECLYRDFKEV